MPLFLETEHLYLREWRDSDLAATHRYVGDPVVRAHFPRTLNRDQTAEMIASFRARDAVDGFSAQPLILKSTGRQIGQAGLMRPDFVLPNKLESEGIEVGWSLAREYWGDGHATAIGHALIAHARNAGLADLISFTAVSNARSERVMQRIGMAKWGHFEHPKLPADHPLCPHVLYQVRFQTPEITRAVQPPQSVPRGSSRNPPCADGSRQ